VSSFPPNTAELAARLHLIEVGEIPYRLINTGRQRAPV
jgi:hypothetical protein